jgi:hypothetical protein
MMPDLRALKYGTGTLQIRDQSVKLQFLEYILFKLFYNAITNVNFSRVEELKFLVGLRSPIILVRFRLQLRDGKRMLIRPRSPAFGFYTDYSEKCQKFIYFDAAPVPPVKTMRLLVTLAPQHWFSA